MEAWHNQYASGGYQDGGYQDNSYSDGYAWEAGYDDGYGYGGYHSQEQVPLVAHAGVSRVNIGTFRLC